MEEISFPLYLQQCWRPRGVFEMPHLGDVTAQAPVHTAALVTDQDPPVYGCPARICKRSHSLEHRKQHDLGLQKQSLKWAALPFNLPCLATGWACECYSLAGRNGKHQSWHSWGMWDSKDSEKVCSGNLGKRPTACSSSCENTFPSKHNRTLNLSPPWSALLVILWTPTKVFQTTAPTFSLKKTPIF